VTTHANVLVVGSLNRDYVVSVDRLPRPGETRLGGDLAQWCGGKGGNQAVAAALIGAGHDVRVAVVGAVGADDDGKALLQGLRDAGVDVDDVAERADVRSGVALITVDEDGENTIVVSPGANASVTADEVVAVLSSRSPAVVVVQCELPAEVVATVVSESARVGARLVLNLAPVVSLDASVLAVSDPLVVNESEAAELLGQALEDGGAGAAALELSGHARSVVLTMGANGAYVVEDGVCSHVPARSVTAVDTTGAGDAFTGGLGVALALGSDLLTAATWGTEVAAYAVARPGAQASFPTWRDVDLSQSRAAT
jgi:ribokinase